MKKILWFGGSQRPVPVQIAVLERMFKDKVDVEWRELDFRFKDANEFVRRLATERCDDLVVNAPRSVLEQICKRRLYPLVPLTTKVTDPRLADWSTSGGYYRFTGFKRLLRVEFVFEDLGVDAVRKANDGGKDG